MNINLAMLKWGLRRLMAGKTQPIQSVATREWVLCPDEPTNSPPAIYLDGAMDRVTGVSPWHSWDTERAQVTGGRGLHLASRAYLIENAEISGAFVYRGVAKSRHGFGPENLLVTDGVAREHIDEAHLLTDYGGSQFFGTLMRDTFPLGLIPEADTPCITMVTKPYGHEEGYRRLLGLPRAPLVHNALVRRLTLYTDFAQNSFKAKRYRELRRRLRSSSGSHSAPSGPGIYLKRGATGERRVITNETEVEHLLAGLGFDIVEPNALTVEEIARRSLDARVIVGVEGSHLSHVIYSMADDGAYLVIQPPDRFTMTFKDFTDRMDMRFGFVVGKPEEDGFSVDLDELQRMLEKLL